jgi:hypothetical protein
MFLTPQFPTDVTGKALVQLDALANLWSRIIHLLFQTEDSTPERTPEEAE